MFGLSNIWRADVWDHFSATRLNCRNVVIVGHPRLSSGESRLETPIFGVFALVETTPPSVAGGRGWGVFTILPVLPILLFSHFLTFVLFIYSPVLPVLQFFFPTNKICLDAFFFKKKFTIYTIL